MFDQTFKNFRGNTEHFGKKFNQTEKFLNNVSIWIEYAKDSSG